MKKMLLLMLALVCLMLSGCSYGEVGLVQNSNGTVIEYYYIPFPEKSLFQCGVSFQLIRSGILPQIKADCDEVFTEFIDAYQRRVQNSQKYTLEEKTQLIAGVTLKCSLPNDYQFQTASYTGIRYEMHFANANCYQEFKNANQIIKEDRVTQEINNFFTTTTKVIKDPIFDKVASDAILIGIKCLNRADAIMEFNLGKVYWEQIKEQLNYDQYASKFSYTYVVPTARVHTNAQKVEKSSEGYYYHTWMVNKNNIDENGESIIQIQYWTVSANRYVWYTLALIIAGVIITTSIIIGLKKEKKILEEFTKID